VGEEKEQRLAAGEVGCGFEEVLEGGDGCAADVEGVGGGSRGGGGRRSGRGGGSRLGGGRCGWKVPTGRVSELVEVVGLSIGRVAGDPAVGEGLRGGGVGHWELHKCFRFLSLNVGGRRW
jgi:hypothetical protein